MAFSIKLHTFACSTFVLAACRLAHVKPGQIQTHGQQPWTCLQHGTQMQIQVAMHLVPRSLHMDIGSSQPYCAVLEKSCLCCRQKLWQRTWSKFALGNWKQGEASCSWPRPDAGGVISHRAPWLDFVGRISATASVKSGLRGTYLRPWTALTIPNPFGIVMLCCPCVADLPGIGMASAQDSSKQDASPRIRVHDRLAS